MWTGEVLVLFFGWEVLVLAGTWERHEALDRDGIVNLFWTPDLENGVITFELHARTRGWVGLGFSANGAMDGSDVVVGWIKDGQTFFTDRHAEGNQPLVDGSQDYELLFASEDEDGLTLRFKRRVDTCDEDDFYITSDTCSLIYAYGETDPDGEDPFYHGRDRCGVKSANLLDPQIELRNDIVIPPSPTTYWCSLFEAPAIDAKQHVIGYRSRVTKGNEAYVHHLVVSLCKTNESDAERFEQFLRDHPRGASCHRPEVDLLVGNCQGVLMGWAVGGVVTFLFLARLRFQWSTLHRVLSSIDRLAVGANFPKQAGYPLRPASEGPTYYRMQMHYDNPQLVDGIRDGSGLTVYYTSRLRAYDMGTIVFGHEVIYTQLVPHGLSHFMTVGHCSAECTKKFLPPEGIRIFAGLLHSHLLGRKMKARVFRDGKELPWILHDDHYDFDYQQSRILREEFNLLPGDHVTVECELDSSARDNATLGGLTTHDEMCEFFVTYYPRVEGMNLCLSAVGYEYVHATFDLGDIRLDP
ncbi:unnamed protein product [Darwinula stevensoni]|uniref:DOMON domain-containing protein n=1 Tax=Darwinula stevensoni TaxID=69355 RepID=A0A7R8XDV5_9CRUS|nr:unnamed protein product [Darwinula stevensoni]CAG0895154.1 unnamed protein product [Darwinula stevensoni]